MYDAHLHFGDTERLGELLRYCSHAELSGAGLVSLPSPGWIHFNPEILYAKHFYPEKFWVFAALEHAYPAQSSGSSAGRSAAPPSLAEQVRELDEIGCDGIKIWNGKPSFQKMTGLTIDGPEFSDAFWSAAEAGLPVLLHAADPLEFWEHGDGEAGGWKDFENYIAQAEAAAAEHAKTVFIFPHLLFLAHDLRRLGVFLDRYPNAFLDISPGMYYFSHLSLQRDAAARFFDEYAGRILFGTDALLFPAAYTMLPYMEEGAVYQRFSLLNDFFFRGESVADPFRLSAPRPSAQTSSAPMLPAPALSGRARDGLQRSAFLELFVDGRPRPLDSDRVIRYLERFPRPLGFSLSELR